MPASAITGADGTATTTFTALEAGTTTVIANNGTVFSSATVVVSGIVSALVSIPDTSANPGETVTVPVNITNVINLRGVYLWLSYDKEIVTVESISDGDMGYVRTAIDRPSAVAKMKWTSPTEKTGDFVFVYVTLKTVGSAGQTSPLDLEVKMLVNSSGKLIPHTVDDGVFEIVAAPIIKSANATRDIAKQILTPGESTNITVTITNNVTQALALDEDIPAGWTLTGVSDDASDFKSSTNEWLWSTVNAGETKTVIYSLTVPNSASAGDYSVSGTISNASGIIDAVKGETAVTVSTTTGFDTGPGTYPSISGTHTGTIKPNQTIYVSKLYTYPCSGTGGHTESIAIYENETLIANGTWNGYIDDWNNISFATSFTLEAGETYNYTIRTGSYPQIIHAKSKDVTEGTITCTEFVDANGKAYNDWIPAIRLE